MLGAAGRDGDDREPRLPLMREAARIAPRPRRRADRARPRRGLGMRALIRRPRRAYRQALAARPAPSRRLSGARPAARESQPGRRSRRSGRGGRGRGVAEAELGFIRAWALRRQGKFAEALPLAEAIAGDHPSGPPRAAHRRARRPARRAGARLRRLRGDERAPSVAAPPAPAGPTYRETVEREAAPAHARTGRLLAEARRSSAAPPDPIFLVGFPARARPCSTLC